MYTLLNVLGRVVRVLWMVLWFSVVGLIIAAAVIGFPYVLAQILLWLEAHDF